MTYKNVNKIFKAKKIDQLAEKGRLKSLINNYKDSDGINETLERNLKQISKCYDKRSTNINKRHRYSSIANYSPRDENQKKAYKSVCDYVSTFSEDLENNKEPKSFIFYGGKGTGKTHLSAAIVNHLFNENKNCYYEKFSRLYLNYTAKSDFNSDMNCLDYLDQLANYDLLIIDEILESHSKDNQIQFLSTVFDDRYEREKPTILVTNLTLKQFNDTIDSRIISRLYETGTAINFGNYDCRKTLKLAV